MGKLYIGNLPYSVTEEELSTLFGSKGEVVSVQIISDHQSGRSKGFGFVEMSSKEESEAVISDFNGYDLKGRSIRVNESIDKPRKKFSGGGGRGNGGGGGGGGRRW